jgi:hypothetical protein
MSTKVKTITLAAWNEKYGSNIANGIYVVNNMAVPAEVIFNVVGANGQPSAVSVPNTNAPLDLTAITTREAILNSHEFKRLLSMQYLVLIDNLDAERILSENSELREAAAVALKNNGGKYVARSVTETFEIGGAKAQPSESLQGKMQSANLDVEDADDDLTAVEEILGVSEDPEATDDQVVKIFNKFSSQLNSSDLEELMDKSKNSKLQDLIAEKI